MRTSEWLEERGIIEPTFSYKDVAMKLRPKTSVHVLKDFLVQFHLIYKNGKPREQHQNSGWFDYYRYKYSKKRRKALQWHVTEKGFEVIKQLWSEHHEAFLANRKQKRNLKTNSNG